MLQRTQGLLPSDVVFQDTPPHQLHDTLADTPHTRTSFEGHLIIPVEQPDHPVLNKLRNSHIYKYPNGVVINSAEDPLHPLLHGLVCFSLDHAWYLLKLAMVPGIGEETIQAENQVIEGKMHQLTAAQQFTPNVVGLYLSSFLTTRRLQQFALDAATFDRCAQLGMPALFLHKFGSGKTQCRDALEATGNLYLFPELRLPWGSQQYGVIQRHDLGQDLSYTQDNLSGKYMMMVRRHVPGTPFLGNRHLGLWPAPAELPPPSYDESMAAAMGAPPGPRLVEIVPRTSRAGNKITQREVLLRDENLRHMLVQVDFLEEERQVSSSSSSSAAPANKANLILPVVDVSGSMRPMTRTVEELVRSLQATHQATHPGVPFTVITFSHVVKTQTNYISIDCGGGTQYLEAFRAARSHLLANPGIPHCLVFITDGEPGETGSQFNSIPGVFQELVSLDNVSEATIYGIRSSHFGLGIDLLNRLSDTPKVTFSEVQPERMLENVANFASTSRVPTHNNCVVVIESDLPPDVLVLHPVTKIPQRFPLRVELGNLVAPAKRYISVSILHPPPNLRPGTNPILRCTLTCTQGQQSGTLSLNLVGEEERMALLPDEVFHRFRSRAQILDLIEKITTVAGSYPTSPDVAGLKVQVENILTSIGGSHMVPALRACLDTSHGLKDLNAMVNTSGRRQQAMSRQTHATTGGSSFDEFLRQFEAFYQQLFPQSP